MLSIKFRKSDRKGTSGGLCCGSCVGLLKLRLRGVRELVASDAEARVHGLYDDVSVFCRELSVVRSFCGG